MGGGDSSRRVQLTGTNPQRSVRTVRIRRCSVIENTRRCVNCREPRRRAARDGRTSGRVARPTERRRCEVTDRDDDGREPIPPACSGRSRVEHRTAATARYVCYLLYRCMNARFSRFESVDCVGTIENIRSILIYRITYVMFVRNRVAVQFGRETRRHARTDPPVSPHVRPVDDRECVVPRSRPNLRPDPLQF